MDKSNFMPTGSPFLSLLNLAIPASSIPLMMRFINFTRRLDVFESCIEERTKGIKEQSRVNKQPNKKAVVLFIDRSPFSGGSQLSEGTI